MKSNERPTNLADMRSTFIYCLSFFIIGIIIIIICFVIHTSKCVRVCVCEVPLGFAFKRQTDKCLYFFFVSVFKIE